MSSAVSTVSAVEGSLIESCRDNFFVSWQGEKVCSDAPETGKGEAVSTDARGAAAASRAWLKYVKKINELNAVKSMTAWTDWRARRQVAPQGNFVTGEHVSFELGNLAALVNLGVEHSGKRGIVEVAPSQWVGLGVRGTSAGRAGSQNHFPRSRRPRIGRPA